MYERAGIFRIAQDLATVLGVIRSSLRFIAEGELSPQQRTEVALSLDATKRAAALAERLAAVSGGPPPPPYDADGAGPARLESEESDAPVPLPVPSVLVVDEDKSARDSLLQLLLENELDAIGVGSAAGALQLMRSRPFDVVVTEQFMSAIDGTQLLELTREHSPKTAGVLLTSQVGPDVILAAVNQGRAVKILLKNMKPLAIRDEITSIALEMVRKR